MVTGLDIPGKGTRNVVFVATMRNMVYAFDADSGDQTPLWKTSLGAPHAVRPHSKRCGRDPRPVQHPAVYRHHQHARDRPREGADVRRGEDRGAAVSRGWWIPRRRARSSIASTRSRSATGAVVRTDRDSDSDEERRRSRARMWSRRHLQRAALLLANGKVYVAFGAHQDAPPFQGWLIAFDARDAPPARSGLLHDPRWRDGRHLAGGERSGGGSRTAIST